MSSTDVVQRTPQQALMDRLEGENVQKALVALLPENVTPERFRRVFGTALMANPDIAEAETNSVIRALLSIAEMGLMPDGREAAIVVRQNRKKGIKEAQGQAMVAGVRKRFAEHGWTIRTQHVLANDEFEYVLIPEEDVARHVRVRPGAERGDLLYAYAIGTHRDGRRQVKVIDRDRAMAAKAKAQYTGPGSPWAENEPQMWEKTAAHDWSKQVGLAEDDRIVAIFAPPEPAEAAKAIYGPNGAAALAPGETVDRSTGEITNAGGSPPPVGGRPAVAPQTPQAEPVASSPSEDTTGSVPEDDDPEPTAVSETTDDGGDAVIPGGAYEGRTLAEVATLGPDGEEYLAWMARNAGRSSVGPAAHAALQKFRPALFESKD